MTFEYTIEKRKQKGFLFTIGDEPVLSSIPKSALKGIMGEGQYGNVDAVELLDNAREKYNVFHIHIKETASGSRQEVIDGWKQLLQDNLIVVEKHQDVSKIITSLITGDKKKPASKTNDDNEMML